MIFGDVHHKIEEHMADKLIKTLASTGVCDIPQIGSMTYSDHDRIITFKPTPQFEHRLHLEATKATRNKNG